jgi:MFS transporter, AAHS family, 4-hydroxybenzoate transporter
VSAPASAARVDNAETSWTLRSASIVGLCFVTNMVDGMDVNVMSYVRGALSKDWGVADSVMGYVLSAGTFGMGLGALGIAPFADKFGRKPVIMFALALMSLGMLASALVGSVTLLMLARLVVGMGIGTVLATMAALAAESAPQGKQDMAVGMVQAGFPLAAVATGFVAASTIPTHGWQALLMGAGLVTLVMLPAAWLILPTQLPRSATEQAVPRARLSTLFDGHLRSRTILLMIAVFMGLLVLYSMMSWITKLATSAGLTEENGIYAGAFYNIGAFFGTAGMGLLTLKFRPTVVGPCLLVLAGVAMLIFGNTTMSVSGALAMAFIIGMTLQGGYNSMWPIAAGAFSSENRATGIGWVMGIGRGGAVVGPILAGYLLSANVSLGSILAIYCLPLMICAACAYLVGRVRAPD